jgi:hypothetical protein
MAFETVQIVSTRNGSSSITGWRQDLVIGDVVSLSLTNNTGVSSYRWELAGRPEGSVAGGTGPEPCLLGTGATASFTVDSDSGMIRDGTYIIHCTLNGGTPTDTIIRVGMARLAPGLSFNGLPLRKLGGFERDEDTHEPLVAQESTKMLDRWLGLIQAGGGSGGGGGSGPVAVLWPTNPVGDQSGDLVGNWLNVASGRHLSYEFMWTGTPTGVLSFQISNDGVNPFPFPGTFSPPITQPAGGAGSAFVDLVVTDAAYIRPIYTRTSGTGSITGIVMLKVSTGGAGGSDAHDVKADSVDGAPAFLDTKLKAGANVSLAVVVDAGIRKVQITSTGGGGGTADVADWDITEVRYFFLDGDAGNDAHIGYIDATPGTDFTSRAADVAAVAIKTTSRLEAITPRVGAGRMVVRLFKPRAGGVIYDNATFGDHHGRDWRHQLSGYQMLSRGSDLTNSFNDRSALGYINALVGPNGDGSWTVGAISEIDSGNWQVTLTGATLPIVTTLTQWRLRWSAGYAAIRWGSVTAAGSDTLTAWHMDAPPSPGDHVWLEKPGVVLSTFRESSTAGGADGASKTSVAGITFTGGCIFGHADDPSECRYTGIVMSPFGVGANAKSSLVFDGTFIDETGASHLGSGPSISAPNCNVNVKSIDVSFGTIATPAVGSPSLIKASAMNIKQCNIQTCTFVGGEANGSGGPMALGFLSHGALLLQPSGACDVNAMRGVAAWNSAITVQPSDPPWQPGVSVSFRDMHNLLIAVEAEPNTPGIILKNGQYTATLDFGNESRPGTISCGNGVRVEYNGAGDQFTLVNYDSLLTTGFEVIGGQKVVVMATLVADAVNYAGGVLPCPRGTPMKIVNVPGSGDSPGPSPCGLVVVGGDQAWFLSGSLEPQNIIGATLTNYANNADLGGGNTGGWVVVGNDSVMVLQVDSVSATPAVGVPVFASFHDEFSPGLTGGCSVTEYQVGDFPSFCLGHVLPVGIRGTIVTVAWKPSHLASQMRAIWSAISMQSYTTPSDVQGMFFTVEAGATYSVHGRLHVSTGAGVNNGGIKLAFTGTASATVKCNLLMAFEENSTGLTVSLPTLVSTGDDSCVSYAGSSSTYDVVINGSFVADSSGELHLRFSQALSKTVASQITFGVLVATRNR